MLTYSEISRVTGVSRSTVGRVVRNDTNVHSDTRRSVQEQIDRLQAAMKATNGRDYVRNIDIANATGFSTRTVSRVFNDWNVNSKTRDRVVAAAEILSR